MTDVARALCETYLAYHRLAGEVREGPACRAVRNDAAPTVWDANHLQIGPADTDADADRALAFHEAELGHHAHRQIMTTPFLAPALAARLALENYAPDPTLQGLLAGPLAGPAPRACDIRPVVNEDDWAALDGLVRLDHMEVNEKIGKERLTEDVTAGIQAIRRANAEEIHRFLVWSEGKAVAYFSSWPGPGSAATTAPGVGRVGIVEDLYTRPDHRGRGLARALIHHCVADARARGADAVSIGAEVDDTPKAIYAAMGFVPTCLTQAWRLDSSPAPRKATTHGLE